MRVQKTVADLKHLELSENYSNTGRDRILLHKNEQSTLHHMLILLDKTSYVRPHRHTNKSESYLILDGIGAYFEFDDDGSIIFSNVLEPYGNKNNNPFVLYVENSKRWHTLISVTKNLYFSESTIGPFNAESTEFAPWSLDKSAPKKHIIEFLKSLQAIVKG